MKDKKVLRAKTIELLKTKELTEQQNKNSEINLKELKEQKLILDSYPRRIVLELTNACNYNCIMCGRSETKFNLQNFNIDWLEKLKDSLYFTEEVTLFGWGEPTLHPNFIDILKFLDYQTPVKKYFVTNGSQLNKIKEAVFKYKVDILAISLDGATSKTNDKIRKGANFNKIIANIKDIVELRGTLNFPYMNFVFVAMQSNIHELLDMVKLTADLGLEELKVVFLTIFSQDLIKESLYKDMKIADIFENAIDLADELGIKLKLPYLHGKDPSGSLYHKPCFVGWRDLFIGCDGYIRPCQSTSLKFGKISEYKTFKDVWNSVDFQEFRQRVNNTNDMPYECKMCYQSSHANMNRKESFIQIGQVFAPDWEK